MDPADLRYLLGVGIVVLAVCLNEWIFKSRNRRGCCATCGDTVDIYQATQRASESSSFMLCRPCARKVDYFRLGFYALVIALLATSAFLIWA